MMVPKRIPGLRWMMAATAVYAVIWMSLEGDLRRVILLAAAVSFTLTGFGIQRFVGGLEVQFTGWISTMAAAGLAIGLGSGLLTLLFMVMKTGLHGHGPEFRPSEIEFVWGMIPLWGAAGLAAGFGAGLVIWGMRKSGPTFDD